MDLIELWAIFGPAVAGAVFGAGWWFWVDAVVCSSVAVSFLHYLPGIFASLAALMFNCVRREDIDYSPYEEGEWRVVSSNRGWVSNNFAHCSECVVIITTTMKMEAELKNMGVEDLATSTRIVAAMAEVERFIKLDPL
ncbi:unnamed protein product [Camellia sinensis]